MLKKTRDFFIKKLHSKMSFSFMFLLPWNNFCIEKLHSDQVELQIKSFLYTFLLESFLLFRACPVESSWGWIKFQLLQSSLIFKKKQFFCLSLNCSQAFSFEHFVNNLLLFHHVRLYLCWEIIKLRLIT